MIFPNPDNQEAFNQMVGIDARQLFEEKRQKLGLTWEAGRDGGDRSLDNEAIARSTQGMIGHLNFIHPNWIQVLSETEAEYLNALDPASLEQHMRRLAESDMLCIIVTAGACVPDSIKSLADSTRTPLFCTPYSSLEILWILRPYLGRVLAPSCSRHGVLLDVLGLGVMITGESSVGKSELALELVSRGHGLVADDVVELYRIAPETLEGRCPPMLRDFLEVRGLGMLNIRTIFGEAAVRRKKNMKLIVHLQKPNSADLNAMERLPINDVTENILDVNIRKVIIPVAAGRNLAVLVEAAVRNYVLQLRGIDSGQEFFARHQQELENGQT
ncbi:Hpr(Ser) kinase/phosphatase [Nitrosospira multiformis ATCC 25196]|jgi:HPr kinase/phosphorylase|uniref:HPr kinase/phosphorylase n=2 Tax=Nitrosospira multiformis TaxID=1231 RepID=Q2YCY0_NITMU|nr:Hpr(Ser) kinase/phosphatase [Nitrosospira multiformis ATCC 25196]SEA69577.1 Hpr(Ser) kinase/phosphatase [Nitrosospira multiformis]SEG09746.1 Hpr(Ser) kinase/phosphatase [Nitrosospira multiformis ATCC 25196]